MITEDLSVMLSDNLPANTKTLFKQLMHSSHTYPPEIKSFALTLNFYSSRAYNYVRKTFNNILPNPRTLQKWYASVSCESGFNTESVNALKLKVAECTKKNKACVCALMIDEMSIHKKVEWDGEKFIGYVDIDKDVNMKPEAKEAIVFMLNCVNDRWKLPIGYFFVDGLSGNQKSNLIELALSILHETGMKICSLTFDGAATNMAMALCLGVQLSSSCLSPSFAHPLTKERIQLLLDPPHMLKLIRNTLGTCEILYDDHNNEIKWEYIVQLVDVQEREGLHVANKLTRRHINWQQEKMRVKLAAQTFSRSVAKSLQYLRESNYSANFANTEATERFILYINDAFDILNSRNLLSKGFKAGLTPSNKNIIFHKIEEIIQYLKCLTWGSNREALHLSKKKTGFVGFIICLRSLMQIYIKHIETDLNLKYLLGYKMSQDHLEVFFSAIRSIGGHNNNPTAKLFKAAYKKLLIPTSISGSPQANCIEEVPTIILALSTTKNANKMKTIDNILNETLDGINEREINNDHDYCGNFTYSKKLSLYIRDVVEYIAGFVVKKVKRSIDCETCLSALVSSGIPGTIINIKNYTAKGLTVPSNDVIHICKVAESEIRFVEETNEILKENILQKLIIKIMRNVRPSLFNSYKEHMYDNNVESNHIINLIKLSLL